MIMDINMNKWICLVLFFCFSCNNIEKDVKYYNSGKVKEIIYKNEDGSFKILTFYEDGILKSEFFGSKTGLNEEKKFYNEKGILIVSIHWINDNHITHRDYYSNGKIKSEGQKINNKAFGWWKYFNSMGELIRKDEIFYFNDNSWLNQRIVYKGKIIDKENSILISVSLNDTIEAGKYLVKVKKSRSKKIKSKFQNFRICASTEINRDFSNLNNLKLDTIRLGNYDDLWFPIKLESKGKKTIRGFIVENYINFKNDSTMVVDEKMSFFVKNVFVK